MMNGQQSEKSIFLAAIEIAADVERAAYLDQACGGNLQLRAEVESLLKAHEKSGDLLDVSRAVSPTMDIASLTEREGTVIGRYKLLQEIGEGGMGVVYMAEQKEPVERRVALKIIKPGMDSRQVTARFESERQALAMMDHPNIAKVLDAGATDSGRPYFVMELVKGIPITRYCDEQRLTPRQRLGLFIPVCQAVQHAHQKGIIHRDLKPSNVLVAEYDHEPVPIIIDFGVAKSVGQRLTEKTMFTQFGQIVGTLEYMSPEQAKLNQLDIDTRSDIYSLGVLLYELLTSSTPFNRERFRSAAFEEVMRIIREEDPPKPSTRLRTSATLPAVAADRHVEPQKLPGLVRGELDWIVMKALEKHRGRRYETASDFAADIQRHLDNEPVVACPPSVGYKLRKFAGRHRAALATSAALIAILLVGAVVSTWEAVRAIRAEQLARDSLVTAREALDKAQTAEKAEGEARRLTESQRNLAQEAEEDAEQQRDNAHQAMQRAVADRALAIAANQRAQDALAASLFEQARAVRMSGQTGRSWRALELLREAEQLRGRQRSAIPAAAAEPEASDIPQPTLDVSQLRTEAVAALSLHDGRVSKQWSGSIHAVSPDGRFAASLTVRFAPHRCEALVVDLESGNEFARWEGMDLKEFTGPAFALGPGGETYAVSSRNSRHVSVWQLPEKRRIRNLYVPKRRAEKAALPDDATRLAAEAAPETAKENSGKTSQGNDAESNAMIRHAVFSPNGRYLAAVRISTQGSQAILWDLDGEDEGRVIGQVGDLPASMVIFSPDSRSLALPTDEHTVIVRDLAEQRDEVRIEVLLELIGALGFSADGSLLGVHCREADESKGRGTDLGGTLVVWNVAENREIMRFDTGTLVGIAQVAFSSDNRRVAVAGITGEIRVLDLEDEAYSVTLDHGAIPQVLAWNHKGDHVISAGIGSLKIWELSKPSLFSATELETNGPHKRMASFAFSSDGRWLAVEKRGQPVIVVFERKTGKIARTLEYGDYNPFGLYSLFFSPDAQQLVRLGLKGLAVWDVESGEETARMAADPMRGRTLVCAGFRSDNSLLVSGYESFQRPTVWEAATSKVVWQGTKGPLTIAVVSPDGRFVVTSDAISRGDQSRVRVFGLPGGEQRFQLGEAPAKGLQSRVTLSPDARWILTLHLERRSAGVMHPWTGQQSSLVYTTDENWTGSVWDAKTGERKLEMRGASTVVKYAFSPNGQYLAIGQGNGTVRVWSMEQREELFGWQAWGERARAPVLQSPLMFTHDSLALAVVNPSSAALRVLDLSQVRTKLGEIGLDW
jgi:WD40 repeat protein/tRNA A-37 threonylcarbamoyl transferase component Bud32